MKKPEKKDSYLQDVIYMTTQYLDIPDKDVAVLNRRLFDALQEYIAKVISKSIIGK